MSNSGFEILQIENFFNEFLILKILMISALVYLVSTMSLNEFEVYLTLFVSLIGYSVIYSVGGYTIPPLYALAGGSFLFFFAAPY